MNGAVDAAAAEQCRVRRIDDRVDVERRYIGLKSFELRIHALPKVTRAQRGSPAAGLQPLLDLVEAIGAPEGLPVDHDVRRTENPERHRGFDFAA